MVRKNNLDYSVMRKNLAKNAKYSGRLSQFRNAAMGLATAASMATGSPATASESPAPTPQTQQQTEQAKPSFNPETRKQNILRSIAHVESSGGKNLNHEVVTSGLNAGTRSSSKYGLMPITIKETIKMHPDLREEYGHLTKLKGPEFHKAYHSHEGLDDKLAARHYDRLVQHFGHDPSKIGMAWLNGITGTKRALKRGVDLDNHWHVKKIHKALNKIRSSQGK